MTGLLSKSETYANKVVGNSIYEQVRNHFLISRYRCWVSVLAPPSLLRPKIHI